MNGNVDERQRALLTINVGRKLKSPETPVVAWIDTAFDGHLVFPPALIEQLQLDSLGVTQAFLADGGQVALETYVCFVDWFGTVVPLQVIASDAKFPLLGTELLKQRILHIDYSARLLTLT